MSKGIEEPTLEAKRFIMEVLPICFIDEMNVKVPVKGGAGELNKHRASWEVKRPHYVIDGIHYNFNLENDRMKLIHYICSKDLPEPTKTIDLRKDV